MNVQSAVLLLLLAACAAAPALAARHTLAAAPRPAAATLRCFTGAPPFQDGRPVVMAWTFNKANGFDICVRYQFPCSTSDTSCSAAEAKAGLLKWAYIATSSANCAYLKQVGKNTVCCATDGCNKPDPKLDPTTLIQQNPASGTVLAPAPPAPKPTSGQPVPSTAPAPAVKPSAVKPAAVAHITP